MIVLRTVATACRQILVVELFAASCRFFFYQEPSQTYEEVKLKHLLNQICAGLQQVRIKNANDQPAFECQIIRPKKVSQLSEDDDTCQLLWSSRFSVSVLTFGLFLSTYTSSRPFFWDQSVILYVLSSNFAVIIMANRPFSIGGWYFVPARYMYPVRPIRTMPRTGNLPTKTSFGLERLIIRNLAVWTLS